MAAPSPALDPQEDPCRGPLEVTDARVLVVDDDPGIRESLELALGEHCDVLTASSVADALRVLGRQAVDLTVLDYCLPDGPGSEVLRVIKSRWPSLPIIVITGYGSETLCAQLFRLGVRDYFSKPYELGALVVRIQELLAVPRESPRPNMLSTTPFAGSPKPLERLRPGIRRALAWIHLHYADPISLRQAAGEAAMSPFHFCRVFKLLVGVGFHRYLTRLRIERAKELLRNSPGGVADVAFASGFSELSCFYKAFRRATGQSPSAWRRSARVGRFQQI